MAEFLPGAVHVETDTVDPERRRESNSPPDFSHLPIVSERSSGPSSLASLRTLMKDHTKWAWQHGTGWRDYDPEVSAMIESAFRKGCSKVRLRSCKDGANPTEIFFEDMIQYDPSSGIKWQVLRQGKLKCRVRFARFFNSVTLWMETGQPRRQTLADYQKQQREQSKALLHADTTKFMPDVEATEYKSTGVWASIARSPYFAGVAMVVVILNAAWIAIDLDYNDYDYIVDSDLEFQLVEYFFLIFFVAELLIRIRAFNHYWEALRDRWYLFDSFLVALMIFEIALVPAIFKPMDSGQPDSRDGTATANFVSSALPIVRALRLLRLTKMLRMSPQLMCLVTGIVKALVPMFYTAVLLVLLLYMCGVLFRGRAKFVVGTQAPYIEDMFSSVSQSMITLLMYGTLLDSPTLAYMSLLYDMGPIAASIFLAFIFFSAFTVLNMLIGVLCGVVGQVSAEEAEKAEIRYLQQNLLEILKCYDRDNDLSIAEDEFDTLLQNPEVYDCLARFGTDLSGLVSLKAVLFEGGGKLSFNTILGTIMRLRGANIAKVTDIIELREFVRLRTLMLHPPSPETPTDMGLTYASSSSVIQAQPDIVPERIAGIMQVPGVAGGLRAAAQVAARASAPVASECTEAILWSIRKMTVGQSQIARELEVLREGVSQLEEKYHALLRRMT